jgi:hypothetical protein
MDLNKEIAALTAKISEREAEHALFFKSLLTPNLSEAREIAIRSNIDSVMSDITALRADISEYSKKVPDNTPVMEYLWNRRNVILCGGIEASCVSLCLAACMGMCGCTMRQVYIGTFAFGQLWFVWKSYK